MKRGTGGKSGEARVVGVCSGAAGRGAGRPGLAPRATPAITPLRTLDQRPPCCQLLLHPPPHPHPPTHPTVWLSACLQTTQPCPPAGNGRDGGRGQGSGGRTQRAAQQPARSHIRRPHHDWRPDRCHAAPLPASPAQPPPPSPLPSPSPHPCTLPTSCPCPSTQAAKRRETPAPARPLGAAARCSAQGRRRGRAAGTAGWRRALRGGGRSGVRAGDACTRREEAGRGCGEAGNGCRQGMQLQAGHAGAGRACSCGTAHGREVPARPPPRRPPLLPARTCIHLPQLGRQVACVALRSNGTGQRSEVPHRTQFHAGGMQGKGHNGALPRVGHIAGGHMAARRAAGTTCWKRTRPRSMSSATAATRSTVSAPSSTARYRIHPRSFIVWCGAGGGGAGYRVRCVLSRQARVPGRAGPPSARERPAQRCVTATRKLITAGEVKALGTIVAK